MPQRYNKTSNHGIGTDMNAEDLVITLKKNMAKLSKSERRRLSVRSPRISSWTPRGTPVRASFIELLESRPKRFIFGNRPSGAPFLEVLE